MIGVPEYPWLDNRKRSDCKAGPHAQIRANRRESRRNVQEGGQCRDDWPCFSPDGSLIVFGSTRDGNYEIYTMQSDGMGVRRLTNSPTMDMRPKFSPDGQRLCFTSNRDENYGIYVMSFDGSDLQQITNHPERNDYATWHPNGKQLLMVSERSGNHDLYFVELPR